MGEQHQVYLGLGANLGDRRSNLLQALQLIRSFAVIRNISSTYETKPVGYLDQPNFLNLVCQVTTELTPAELLVAVKKIEKQLGRQASFRNAPRVIDVDILLYDDRVVDTPDLIIPHARLAERAFVLVPLAEIAPHLIHPVLGRSVAELLQGIDPTGVEFYSQSLSSELDAGLDI